MNMNPQMTDHGYLHNDDNFYEVAEEFTMDFYEDAEECIMDETDEVGDLAIAEVSQTSSGSHITEHSYSQRLPHRPEGKDERPTLTEQSVDLQVPEGSLLDILSAQEEDKNGDQKSLVEENEAPKPSQHLQEPSQQQHSEPEQKTSAKKLIPPTKRDIDENSDMRAIVSSHNPHGRRFFCVSKALLFVIVSTFGLIMVRKLLRHR